MPIEHQSPKGADARATFVNTDRILYVDASHTPELLLIDVFHELVHAVQDIYAAAVLLAELGQIPEDIPFSRDPAFLAAAANLVPVVRSDPRAYEYGVMVWRTWVGPSGLHYRKLRERLQETYPPRSARCRSSRSTRTPTQATGRRSRARPTPSRRRRTCTGSEAAG